MKLASLFALVLVSTGAAALAHDCPEHKAAKIVEPARAKGSLSALFSDSDYPGSALKAREEGVTRFRLGIGPNGRVTDCAIAASSGSAALDNATCRILRSRARFTPARDEMGHPAADSTEGAIQWRLPPAPAAPPPPQG